MYVASREPHENLLNSKLQFCVLAVRNLADTELRAQVFTSLRGIMVILEKSSI